MVDTTLARTNGSPELGAIERVIALGDLGKLGPEERARYYFELCGSLKLNPLTRPFEYLNLQGKLVLYARKDATDQLRALHRISLEIVSRETVSDLYVVTAKARSVDGRTDEEIGAVSIKGLTGDALANAFMKASTKAKRRVTLSICGLGLLDETELETIREARVVVDERTTFGKRMIEDDEPPPVARASLPASTSGASERMAAEMDALDATLAEFEGQPEPPAKDPEGQPRLVDAPSAPDHPEYRRAVAALQAAQALGMRTPAAIPATAAPEVWTDIAVQWEMAARSKRTAR